MFKYDSVHGTYKVRVGPWRHARPAACWLPTAASVLAHPQHAGGPWGPPTPPHPTAPAPRSQGKCEATADSLMVDGKVIKTFAAM